MQSSLKWRLLSKALVVSIHCFIKAFEHPDTRITPKIVVTSTNSVTHAMYFPIFIALTIRTLKFLCLFDWKSHLFLPSLCFCMFHSNQCTHLCKYLRNISNRIILLKMKKEGHMRGWQPVWMRLWVTSSVNWSQQDCGIIQSCCFQQVCRYQCLHSVH